MKLFANLALVLSSACCQINAQNPSIESITIADGLSQGMVYDIEQTDDGFLWFATKDGLNRYDGYHFEVYTNDPFNPYSIAGNEITRLFEDSKGNLWLGIMDHGFDVLEKATGRFLHFPALLDFKGKFQVSFFRESTDGTMWVLTDKGLLKLRWQNNKDETAGYSDRPTPGTLEQATRGDDKEIIYSVHANQDGSIYILIRGDGIYYYDPSLDRLSLIHRDDISTRSRFLEESRPRKVLFTYTDFDDHVLLYANDSTRKVQSWEKLPYAEAGITQDDHANLHWSTTPPTTTAQKPGLNAIADVQCSSMELDRSGNLWIGTSGYGLRKIKLSRQPFQHFQKGHSVRRVLATDNIYLRLASSNTSWQIDVSSDMATMVPRLSRGITQFYQAKNGGAYVIGFESEHYYLKDAQGDFPKPMHVEFPVHEYTPITEDLAGNIWVGGSDAQLMRFQPSTGKITHLDLSEHLGLGASVYAIYADALQNLWIGTTNGMAQINLQQLTFTEDSSKIGSLKPVIYQTDPNNPVSLRYNFVTSFCDDPYHPERYLWVSTKGGGISMLDKTTNTFHHFTMQNSGLSNDVVYGILPDDNGNLWMSTNRGLSRMTCLPSFYKKASSSSSDEINKEIIFQNFRESDGLQSDEFNTSAYYRHTDGRLMFGGINGLTVFNPSAIKDRQSNAPVRITGLKINNLEVDYFHEKSPLTKPIYQTEQITLTHQQSLVTLDFALMDYVTPQENRFRYKLESVDPDWVDAGITHTASYSQLRPGHYLFEVQGNIGYGQWSKPATLRITVLPPWWASWWAYSVYLLMLSAAVYSIFYFFRKRLLLRHQLKLEHEEANRLKELDRFKSQLFTNLTHEFRTPLTVILGMAKQLADGSEQLSAGSKQSSIGSHQSAVGSIDRGKLANGLKLIENNGKNLLHLINQLLDLSKLENKSFKLHLKQGDIVPYLRYVTEAFQSYANGKNLSLRFFTTIESLLMDFDPEQIKQVMTNLISNALKFTPSGGDIAVKLVKSQEKLGIVVTDTGIGISTKDLPHIFDRFYQADNSTNRAGGTGIGLAHTQELVKIMGGSIAVESEIGKGTSIRLEIPITNKEAVINDHADMLSSIAPGAIAGIPMQPIPDDTPYFSDEESLISSLPQLLIIEDNPDVVVYLKSCLENAYQIVVAYNGKIGIEKAFEYIPDFIISDVMMPEKDGYEVCDVLKNDERTSHIPIILLTAKADAASRIAGLRRGADAYLAKPFDVEELLVQIKVLLDNRRRMASYFSKTLQIGQNIPSIDSSITEDLQIEDAFVKKVKGLIESNYTDENFALPELCLLIGMSRSQLFRKMKAVTDTSPSDLIRAFRLNKAKTLLESGDVTVAEATYQVGFKNPSYFAKLFQEEFGVQPSRIVNNE